MGYTSEQWRNKQITAIDPFQFTESNEAKKITRFLTLGDDLIIGEDSLKISKYDDTHIRVSPGHAIKQDIYINFHDEVIIDINDISFYCVQSTGTIQNPGMYYVVLDYQYVESLPAPHATIKIAKTYETATATQILDELEDNYQRTVNRYLFLGTFDVINDNGVLKISVCRDHDPIHPDYQRNVIDLYRLSGLVNEITLNRIKDLLVVENPDASLKNYVFVNRGYLVIDAHRMLEINEQTVGPFDPVSASGKIRYDLVCVDLNGNISIVQGTEYNDGQFTNLVDYWPDIPTDNIMLAAVRILETNEAVILDDDNDILNLRDFVRFNNLVSSSSGSGIIDATCKVYELNPNQNGVGINSGVYISTDNRYILKYNGGTYTGFTPTSADGKYRYDVLMLDDQQNISCYEGVTEYDTPQDPYSLNLTFPQDKYPLAIIQVSGLNPVISDKDIFEARPFINMGGGGANYIRYAEKNDWDGIQTVWTIGYRIDPSKPYILVRDGVVLEHGTGYTIDPSGVITFDTAPQDYTQLYFFTLIFDNDQFIIPPIERTKSDWDGIQTVWDLDFTIDTNHPITVFSDSRHLEPGVDYQIINNSKSIQFVSAPQQYTYLIAYGSVVGPTVGVPMEESIVVQQDGEDTFTLSTFTYTTGTHDIEVFRNGQKIPHDKIIELNSSQFKLDGIYTIAGDVIEVRKFGVVPSDHVYINTQTSIADSIAFRWSKHTGADVNINTGDLTLDFIYVVGKNQLTVTINGVELFIDDDYIEVDSSTIRLNQNILDNLQPDDRIVVRRPYLYRAVDDNTPTNVGGYICKKSGADVAANGELTLDFIYNVGRAELHVSINGLEQYLEDDYIEVSNNKIAFGSSVMNYLQPDNKIYVKKYYLYS